MEFHLTLIFFILIIKNCDNLERPKFYRCGFDDEKYDPIIIKDFKPINKTNFLDKRRLDSDGFKDFNIYLDIANIENDIRINNLDKYHDLFINSMKKAVKTLTNLLKVKPLEDNFEIYDSVLQQLNINHWNKSNFGDAAIYKGNTLSTLNISASGMGFDRKGQPFLGLVKINKNVDYSKEKSQEYFQAIVLHEFTHILGFSISAFSNTYKNIFTKIDDFGVMRTYINSSKVLFSILEIIILDAENPKVKVVTTTGMSAYSTNVILKVIFFLVTSKFSGSFGSSCFSFIIIFVASAVFLSVIFSETFSISLFLLTSFVVII